MKGIFVIIYFHISFSLNIVIYFMGLEYDTALLSEIQGWNLVLLARNCLVHRMKTITGWKPWGSFIL